jgi:integrase
MSAAVLITPPAPASKVAGADAGIGCLYAITCPSASHATGSSSVRQSSKLQAVTADRLWTVHDVSAFLGVPVGTLYQWRYMRIGPPAYRVGRHIRYDPAAVRTWLDTQDAYGRVRYEVALRRQILPRWELVPLAKITHSDVSSWVHSLTDEGLAPATVRYAHRVLSLALTAAVRDGRLVRNVAEGVPLPRVVGKPKRFLTHDQVQALAEACAPYGTLIKVLAFCGLRWGEAAALRVKRVDTFRRRLTVAESVTEVSGRLTWGTPKSHAARSVPMPRSLTELLTQLIAGKAADDLVFTTWRGKSLRNLNFRRDVFDRAADDAGLHGLTPHELRHTAASLAVSSGANVKAVQKMLGHASAAMTLDVYSGLFDDDLDGVATGLEALPGVAPVRPTAQVIELPRRPIRP